MEPTPRISTRSARPKMPIVTERPKPSPREFNSSATYYTGAVVELPEAGPRGSEMTQVFPFLREKVNPIITFIGNQDPSPGIHPDPINKPELPLPRSRFAENQGRLNKNRGIVFLSPNFGT